MNFFARNLYGKRGFGRHAGRAVVRVSEYDVRFHASAHGAVIGRKHGNGFAERPHDFAAVGNVARCSRYHSFFFEFYFGKSFCGYPLAVDFDFVAKRIRVLGDGYFLFVDRRDLRRKDNFRLNGTVVFDLVGVNFVRGAFNRNFAAGFAVGHSAGACDFHSERKVLFHDYEIVVIRSDYRKRNAYLSADYHAGNSAFHRLYLYGLFAAQNAFYRIRKIEFVGHGKIVCEYFGGVVENYLRLLYYKIFAARNYGLFPRGFALTDEYNRAFYRVAVARKRCTRVIRMYRYDSAFDLNIRFGFGLPLAFFITVFGKIDHLKRYLRLGASRPIFRFDRFKVRRSRNRDNLLDFVFRSESNFRRAFYFRPRRFALGQSLYVRF